SNTTGAAATVNLSIGGVSAGKTVTLLFSNGTASAAATTPSSGVLASPAVAAEPGLAPVGASAAPDRFAAAHDRMLQEQQKWAAWLHQVAPHATAAPDAARLLTKVSASPAVGSSRVWNDTFASPAVAYNTTVDSVCSVPGGRNVVFWLDPNAVSAGNVKAGDMAALNTAYCGTGGGYGRLAALLGDAWGPVPAAYASQLIQDGAALQDINVVVLNVPSSTGWAGYFDSGNNLLKTVAGNASSNEALVFFINAGQIKLDRQFVASTLIHESTHMINFYQRTLTRNTNHDTWLEETSAMMSEDIVSPAVLGGYNKIGSYRLPSYLQTGGAVSYITWPQLSGPNYALGGAFGAFLNRRYGLALYKQLVTNCNDGTGTGQVSSYACLDALIKSGGGVSFADEFAHFGATVFAKLAPGSISGGRYGYPARSDSGYTLGAIDVSALTTAVPAPTALNSGYTATTHTYQVDTVPAGKTTYVRNGVSVPANTTLLVVVQ
ncbi:MAG: hypothetical protein KGQ77_09455, partial [Betaproteobacteria bacterium]|nr:hypothetical protein [Betaproteobacteria bacterium]